MGCEKEKGWVEKSMGRLVEVYAGRQLDDKSDFKVGEELMEKLLACSCVV